MAEGKPGFLRRNCLSRRALMSSTERDDRGWTLLHIGAREGDLKLVKRLLDEGMDVNVRAWGPKSRGLTPLHLAAQGGHLQVMEELLERGANIDARTKGACGWTPLHNAAKKRSKAAIKFLIENGAFLPPDIDDCRFNPPLYYCPGLEFAYEEMKRLHQENENLSSVHVDSWYYGSGSYEPSTPNGRSFVFLSTDRVSRIFNFTLLTLYKLFLQLIN